MSFDEMVNSESCLAGFLDRYAAEIERRNLIVRSEFDSRFQMRRDQRLESAFEGLFRFVFSTLPNGCEIYLSSSLTIASVASLASGTVTLRWQVVGDARPSGRGGVATIRPLVGGAALHARSRAVGELVVAFRDVGWTLGVDAMNGDRELWLCASTK